MIDEALQQLERVLGFLEARPGLWVILLALFAGIAAGMAYKRTIIASVSLATGRRSITKRCAQAHGVLTQILSGLAAFVVCYCLWPYRNAAIVSLCVALGCGLAYDVGRILIAWRYPALAARIGMPGRET